MASDPSTGATTLSALAALLQAIAWPITVGLFLLIFRARIGLILDVLAQKLRDAKRVRAGQVEIETAQELGQVLDHTGQKARSAEIEKQIPDSQIRAAHLVRERLTAAPIAFSQKLDVVYEQIYELVDEYEKTRRNLPSGHNRTRLMNEIAAKLRALSIVAYPLLPSLTTGKRHGERLAAICILQVKPELGYFEWLIDRIMQEDQPFLLFHAALAILEMMKSHPYLKPESASESIRRALERVHGFTGGQPDQNTIDVLNEALSLLNS